LRKGAQIVELDETGVSLHVLTLLNLLLYLLLIQYIFDFSHFLLFCFFYLCHFNFGFVHENFRSEEIFVSWFAQL